MKKFKLKIKFFLIRFFGIDEVLKELEKEREDLRIANKIADDRLRQYAQLIRKVDLFDKDVIQKSRAGLEVHQNYGKSWAIIALGTNPESIRFYSFDEKDSLKEMADFLRYFDKKNRTVNCRKDTEYYFKHCF